MTKFNNLGNFSKFKKKTIAYFRMLELKQQVRKERQALGKLDDFALLDIGISRRDAGIESRKSFFDIADHRMESMQADRSAAAISLSGVVGASGQSSQSANDKQYEAWFMPSITPDVRKIFSRKMGWI